MKQGSGHTIESGGTKGWRAGRRRPSLPDEVGDPIVACREIQGERDGVVDRWVRERQPALGAAIRAWGRRTEDAHAIGIRARSTLVNERCSRHRGRGTLIDHEEAA